MKRSLFFHSLGIILMLGIVGCGPAATPEPTPVPPTPTPSLQDFAGKFHWFGTSAFLYTGSKIVYFDPVTLDGTLPKADLILVTHGHSDHWSIPDLKKIIGPNTQLVISPNSSTAYEANKADLGIPATILAEGQTAEVAGVSIQAVPAYGAGHPHEAGGVGFIVTLDGKRIYMAGGTDVFPEMAQYTCDIAFIPAYTRDLAQALVEAIPARLFIIEHTSYYGAKALGDLFTQQGIGAGKAFMALETGPNSP
jgi:L-ascorbate metabolism protein UlaG (beta-lactamase superfamily)